MSRVYVLKKNGRVVQRSTEFKHVASALNKIASFKVADPEKQPFAWINYKEWTIETREALR